MTRGSNRRVRCGELERDILQQADHLEPIPLAERPVAIPRFGESRHGRVGGPLNWRRSHGPRKTG